MPLTRRELLRNAGVGAAGLCLPACSPSHDARYTAEDAAGLLAQREREAAAAGKGRFGVQRYRGYRGLAELPWFELDGDGVLRRVADDVPEAIDMHCHLGMSLLLAPEVDLGRKTPRVKHLLDCDAEEPGCELDLDVYINGNFTRRNLFGLRFGVLAQGTIGSRNAETQTIPNLLEEMDRMRVRAASVLPLVFGLPFGDDLPERWHAAIEAQGAGDRLLLGASVHHADPDPIAHLERQAARGARIVKLHPTMQRFYPDADEMMEIYAACERLGLDVFFHCGRAGIEPESSHRYALPRHYDGALSTFPNVRFILGHGGARDGEAALELALRHDNAWIGGHGHGVSHLDTILRRTGGERVLFGTDWPFYHLAATLAKALIVTEGNPALRDAVLRGNALAFLGDAAPASA